MPKSIESGPGRSHEEDERGEGKERIDRRDFLKLLGSAAASAALLLAGLREKKAEATELREGMSYKEGLEAFMKDVFENTVESGSWYVKRHEGGGEWITPKEGTGGETEKGIQEMLARISPEIKARQVAEAIHLHTHILEGSETRFPELNLSRESVDEMKRGVRPRLSIPPSETDIRMMAGQIFRAEDFRQYGFDTKHMTELVTDPRGLWGYIRDERSEDQLMEELQRWYAIEDKWISLVLEKTKNFSEQEKASVRRKIYTSDPETISKYFVTPNEQTMHTNYMEIRQIKKDREARFNNARDSFMQKSISGDLSREDYQDLAQVYHQISGINLSFTSYEELGLSYKK